MTIEVENPKLYELLIQYLRLVGTQEMINIVMQQHNYRQVTSYCVSDTADVSNIIKGADWDKSSSDYNLVASLVQRQNDVRTYPAHKAYIYGKRNMVLINSILKWVWVHLLGHTAMALPAV